jgi:regulatory protein
VPPVKPERKPEPSLRARALKLLAGREHSRHELRRKLAPHAESAEQLEALLDDLTRRSQLSDARFAELRARVLSRKYGAGRIAHELRAKGVSDEVIAASTGEARATELARAKEAWRKRFGKAPADALEKAKQMRFLQSRGFSFDTIRAVIAGSGED